MECELDFQVGQIYIGHYPSILPSGLYDSPFIFEVLEVQDTLMTYKYYWMRFKGKSGIVKNANKRWGRALLTLITKEKRDCLLHLWANQ